MIGRNCQNKKWYNDGERNYQLTEEEKILFKNQLFSGMIKRNRQTKKQYKKWYNDGEKNYQLTEEEFLLKMHSLVSGKIDEKLPKIKNEKSSNFSTNKHTIPCYDKSGTYKRISKKEYYSQQGPIEDREWVFNTSKEGLKRKGKNLVKSTKNSIPCYNKKGEYISISKEIYKNQFGDMSDWEYVTIRSFEGKKRKIN